jgi:pyruvate/2-oxoglutarate dehydrogenase complex dihydrolipoamide acyltransferase (E2) component
MSFFGGVVGRAAFGSSAGGPGGASGSVGRIPASVPTAPVPVSGTASVRSRRTRRVDPGWADALTERRRAIRAVVGRRMAKSAAAPQVTVFVDIDLEALDRVREGLGVHFLQALVTPSEVRVSSLGRSPGNPRCTTEA